MSSRIQTNPGSKQAKKWSSRLAEVVVQKARFRTQAQYVQLSMVLHARVNQYPGPVSPKKTSKSHSTLQPKITLF